MAIHTSIPSMLQESLVEIILVAEYCINYRKDPKKWGSSGCYGYPAAILLFSIADAIGSYVIGGKTRQHFNILNHKNYYNLGLNKKSVDMIYEKYRCLLTHNAVMSVDVFLDIGSKSSPVFKIKDGKPFINLLPFFIVTKNIVLDFLEKADSVVYSSKTLQDILKK